MAVDIDPLRFEDQAAGSAAKTPGSGLEGLRREVDDAVAGQDGC
jgi:hypothetical protein